MDSTYTYHALSMNMNRAVLFYANKESGCSSWQFAVFYGFIICCFCCEGRLCSRQSHALQAMYEGGKCFCCYLRGFLTNRLVTLLTVSCRKMDALQAMYEGGKCFCCYLRGFLTNRLVTLLTVSCRKMDALQAMYEGGKCFCKSIGCVVDCKL